MLSRHVLKNDEKDKEERKATRAVVSRVIALGANAFAFAFALLAVASGYLLYHYNCNEMLRDVTGSASASIT